jgi:putative ABC transport system permease protein
MLTSDLILSATAGLTANKGRAFLTMLGVIIGVASVVLMVSMGRSFQNYILEQIESVGTNMVEVIPTGLEKFGGNLESVTLEDYEAVSRLSTVERSTPVIVVSKPVSYGNEEVTPLVFGAYPIFADNYGLKLGSGRMIDKSDDDGARSVVVIGPTSAEDLFGNVDPIGKRVDIGGNSLTIVGVFSEQGSALSADFDKLILMPFSTARSITGQKHLSYMTMRAVGDPELALQDIKSVLRLRHRIDNPEDDPDKDDFAARSAEQITAIVGSVTLGLTVFLALVAAISLIVGGIGIMNIMLVSVTERTQEIGLRKAIGAKKGDILRQFLLESVALTLTGGMIGIVIGVSFGWLLSKVADKVLGGFSFVLSFTAIALAIVMAVGTGLVFGLYPARKAANLHPIEALRFE